MPSIDRPNNLGIGIWDFMNSLSGRELLICKFSSACKLTISALGTSIEQRSEEWLIDEWDTTLVKITIGNAMRHVLQIWELTYWEKASCFHKVFVDNQEFSWFRNLRYWLIGQAWIIFTLSINTVLPVVANFRFSRFRRTQGVFYSKINQPSIYPAQPLRPLKLWQNLLFPSLIDLEFAPSSIRLQLLHTWRCSGNYFMHNIE